MTSQTERRLIALEDVLGARHNAKPDLDLSGLTNDELKVLEAHAIVIENLAETPSIIYMTGDVIEAWRNITKRPDLVVPSPKWFEDIYSKSIVKDCVSQLAQNMTLAYLYGSEAEL